MRIQIGINAALACSLASFANGWGITGGWTNRNPLTTMEIATTNDWKTMSAHATGIDTGNFSSLLSVPAPVPSKKTAFKYVPANPIAALVESFDMFFPEGEKYGVLHDFFLKESGGVWKAKAFGLFEFYGVSAIGE